MSYNLSSDGLTVTIAGTMPESTELMLAVTTELTDVFGRHPAQTFTSRFRTADVSPPFVTAVVPANNAVQVSPSARTFTVTFSEAIRPDGLALLEVIGPLGILAGHTEATGANTLRFTAAADLQGGTRYSIIVNAATDTSGNRQIVSFVSVFQTVDNVPPTVAIRGSTTFNRERPLIELSIEDDLGLDFARFVARVDGQPAAVTHPGSEWFVYPLNDLIEGDHTLTVTVFDLAGNQASLPPTTFTVHLQPSGTIRGRVLLADGATPIGFSYLRLSGPISRQVSPAIDGSYEFADLPLGTYGLEVNDAGSIQARATVPLLENGAIVVRDLLVVARGTVRGRVFNPNGTPATAPNIVVTVQSLNPEFGAFRHTQLETPYEDYAVSAIPIGPIVVTATDAANALRAEVTGTLEHDGDTLTLDVTMTNSAVAMPYAMYDGNNLLYAVQPDGSAIGSFNAFRRTTDEQAAARLDVVVDGAASRFTGSSTATVEINRRQVAIRQAGVGGLTVTRKVYVPPTGYFARYLDLFTNTGGTPVTADLRLTSHHGFSSSVRSTTSGDATLDVANATTPDRWVVLDDNSDAEPANGNAPSIGFLLSGPGAADAADAATDGNGVLTTEWRSVTVPPGATVGYLHFVLQQVARDAAQASMERLSDLPPEALTGLTGEEAAAIRNFAVPSGLVSSVPPIVFGGTITGRVFGGDGVTPVPTIQFGTSRQR